MVFLALAVVSATPTSAETILVSQDGSGDFQTLSDGLAAALPGDTVSVACGLYHERDLTLAPGVTLMSIEGDAACVTLDPQDLGRGLVVTGPGDASRIVGLTITGGRAQGDGTDRSGGAISADDAQLVIADCSFSENSAQTDGGAVYAVGGTLDVQRCSFTSNSTDTGEGGAIVANLAQVSIASSQFYSNQSGDDGGAIYLTASTSWVTGCSFWGNSAEHQGGALHLSGEREVVVSGCSLVANAAPSAGGIRSSLGSRLMIERSIIAHSLAGEGMVESLSGFQVECTDIYGNAGGDWVGLLAGLGGTLGNFSQDPLFCGWLSGEIGLDHASPCLPGRHPYSDECGLVGALEAECGVVAVDAGASDAPLSIMAANPVGVDEEITIHVRDGSQLVVGRHLRCGGKAHPHVHHLGSGRRSGVHFRRPWRLVCGYLQRRQGAYRGRAVVGCQLGVWGGRGSFRPRKRRGTVPELPDGEPTGPLGQPEADHTYTTTTGSGDAAWTG